ncbi:MAG: acetylserotonin O-methyltransferase [Desulfobacterales bacterium]|nr:acetylserotonin O-methyltransferase [Desulfobacterales bacterium]
MDKGNKPPREKVLEMTMGLAISRCIYAAAKLGIADHLTGGEMSCDTLAKDTGTHPGSLYRLMRALAGVGMFSETDPGRFRLTPEAECLKRDVPGSLREFILLRGEEEFAPWEEVVHTVKTGESAFEKVYGSNRAEYLKENPKAAERYNRAMAGISAGGNNEAVMNACDFSGIRRLVLVGGDQSILFGAILQKYPDMEGVLMDMGETGDAVLRKQGLGSRYTFIKDDFLASVPPSADAYLTGLVHALTHDNAVRLLKNCYDAMPEKSLVFAVERMIAPETPWRVSLADMNMLIMTGGGIRTKDEFSRLFREAGFQKPDIISTGSVMSVIRAEKQS